LRDDFMGEKWGHSTVMRRVCELGVDLTVAGARALCDEEKKYYSSDGVKLFGSRELDSKKIADSVRGKRVYVSVDLDVLDPLSAPGVGNPEVGGVEFNNLIEVIRSVVDSSQVVGFDVCELAPEFDSGGASSAAARIIVDFLLR